MSYSTSPIEVVSEKTVDPRPKTAKTPAQAFKWWNAKTDEELKQQLLSTYEFLKKTNQYRIKQASIFTRLFSGKPLYNFFSSNSTLDQSNQLPLGRPTANVVYSCTDTLVSRISQDRPTPVFLTNGGNYKEQRLAKDANQFVQGELFRTKAYELSPQCLTDSCVLGNGFLKVYPKDKKVCVERTLEVELLVDFNDAYYGNPRQLLQYKLVDRDALESLFPKAKGAISGATKGNVDTSPRATETTSDQIIVVEGWHLPSNDEATDGRHVLVCDRGIILDEKWKRDHFPFVKFSYNPNPVGWFAQSLSEILMPTQMEIYRMLIVASQNLELMGVPRILIDEMSKILETAFNNRSGSIIKYRGTKPEFVNAQGNSLEIYEWIKWLIQNAYQMSGISSMSAQGVKPPGLNSGESIRQFDDIQTDRFAALAKRYQNIYIDLSYLIIDAAEDIYDQEGSYATLFVGKDGTREVDFSNIKKLRDTYVIQCYEQSSLPKDPAGRQAKLSEMLAAGEITSQEFRRLSRFPDLEQSDRLANALEERILRSLDQIVEKGDKNFDEIKPDNFILDPTDLASTLCTQYINLYATQELEEEKMNVLRLWFDQVQALKAAAATPPVDTAGVQAPSQEGQLPPTAPPEAPVGPASGVQV